LPTGMPREDEGVEAVVRVCREWLAGRCVFGDSCVFSHALLSSGARQTIGSRASAAQAEAAECKSNSGSSQTRSWADQSEDTWPQDTLPAEGAAASRRQSWVRWAAEPEEGGGGQLPSFADRHRLAVGEWKKLPTFGDRLDFPEYFPSANPPELRQKMSRSAVRRKKRELANKRAEFRDLNIERADRAVVSALALKPQSVARPALHLDFPRSEADSPRRPAAPWPTPRPPDRPRDRASDAAGGAPEQDEEEEEEDDGEEPARPRNRSTKVSL